MTAQHLAPANCYVCGCDEEDHGPGAGHAFWSNADAQAAFDAQPQTGTGAEARYVAQHRPY